MTNNTIKYKNILIENFTASKPVKIDGVHSSDVLYNGAPILIQTPALTICSEKEVKFKLVENGAFFTLLEDLENRVNSVLFENSKDFFNGKAFSKERIERSMNKIVDFAKTEDSPSQAIINNVSFDKNIKIIDKFKEITTRPEYPFEAYLMLSPNKILFNKSNFVISFVVKSMKIHDKKKQEIISKECFLDCDTDKVEQDTAIKNEEDFSEPCFIEEEELNTAISETESEPHVDELDFFE